MSTYMSQEVLAGLRSAQKSALKKSSRLRVSAGEDTYPVTTMKNGGFSVLIEDAPKLRGFVDLYDGTRHLSQCLIIASEEIGGQMHYEYKRETAAAGQPPADYYREANAPIGYIASE